MFEDPERRRGPGEFARELEAWQRGPQVCERGGPIDPGDAGCTFLFLVEFDLTRAEWASAVEEHAGHGFDFPITQDTNSTITLLELMGGMSLGSANICLSASILARVARQVMPSIRTWYAPSLRSV